MSKFTTEQIKAAIKELYVRKDAEANSAYRMALMSLNHAWVPMLLTLG